MTPTKTEIIDLFWRSLWTFIEVAGGILTGDVILQLMDDGSARTGIGKLALASGLGAAISVIKTYISNKNGTGTATSNSSPAVGLQPVASNHATPA